MLCAQRFNESRKIRTSLLVAIALKWALEMAALAGTNRPACPSPAQLAWHKMEYNGFIHFSLNTYLDKEWSMGDETPAIFNPKEFDADTVASHFEKAGMKGFVLVCKHHDGFCLWPTKTTEYNISKAPWRAGKGDMVKEFADAATRHGLKFGVYVSPWDRNHAEYGREAYLRVLKEQVRELLSNYGPIYTIWFDGANGGTGYYGGAMEKRLVDRVEYYRWPELFAHIRALQPDTLIFSDIGPDIRWVGNEHGYANYPCWATYEPVGLHGRPPVPGLVKHEMGMSGTKDGANWIPPECDVSIRRRWFWSARDDKNVLSSDQLLEIYYKSVGRGGSLLLNTPLDRNGNLPDKDLVSILEFKQKRDAILNSRLMDFTNVGAEPENPVSRATLVVDNEPETYWSPGQGLKDGALLMRFRDMTELNVLGLKEAIAGGHRITSWNAQYQNAEGAWEQWGEGGQSIGPHILLRRPRIYTNAIRVSFSGERFEPRMAEIELMLAP